MRRGLITRFAALAIGFNALTLCHADPLPNDHGNSPATATVLSGTSNTVSGVLAYDTDVDVFSFPFRPWIAYTIAVETGTVWDVDLTVIPPQASGVMWRTNSLDSGTAVLDHGIHYGAMSRWYLAVSGMFGFTTGSYQVTVWEHPDQDMDGDGLPDAWEKHFFGDLESADAGSDATGDGLLDSQAYLAGIDPFTTFGISDIARSSPDRIRFYATVAPHGTYDLMVTTNLQEHSWQTIRTWIAGPDASPWVWIQESDSRRFYRLRFRYE